MLVKYFIKTITVYQYQDYIVHDIENLIHGHID